MRQMRDAKTLKQRLKILDAHKRRLERELKKLNEADKKTGKRKSGETRRWSKTILRDYYARGKKRITIQVKLDLLKKWKAELTD